MSLFLVPRRQDRVRLDEKRRRFAERPTAQSARHFQGATTSVTSSWLFRSEGDGSRPSPRSPRRPRPTRRSLALPQGCLQPRAISAGSLEPVRAGTSASESVINIETVLPNEDQRSDRAISPQLPRDLREAAIAVRPDRLRATPA